MKRVPLSCLPKQQVTRTALYGDQSFSYFEFQLWSTLSFQRLYYLRQLGFADRVYPDAVHSRFNHTLGVCQRAEDIVLSAAQNTSLQHVPLLRESLDETADVNSAALREYIASRVDVARLMALVHDLGHIPFGHTLEDEILLFETKHDAFARQERVFNRLVSQFIWGLYDDWIGEWPHVWSPDTQKPEALVNMARQVMELSEEGRQLQLRGFPEFLANLAAAQTAMVEMHRPATAEAVPRPLFIISLLQDLDFEHPCFDRQRDYFLIDAIGNTICADLLDYARRDFKMTGIVGDYDDRVFRWFTLGEKKDDDGVPHVRLAIKVYSKKLKQDILREVLKVLELRYDLTDRVVLHSAKCCASAMLGRVVAALGLDDSTARMLEMGDDALLHWLERQLDALGRLLDCLSEAACPDDQLQACLVGIDEPVLDALSKTIQLDAEHARFECWRMLDAATVSRQREEISVARGLLDRLRSRHYYRLVFEVDAAGDSNARRNISNTYSQPRKTLELAREIESGCGMVRGTVVVHCPSRDSNLKEASVLLLYDPAQEPRPLSGASDIPQLQPYAEHARGTTKAYDKLWRLRVYVHPASRVYAAAIGEFLRAKLDAPNSSYLTTVLQQDDDYASGCDFLQEYGGATGRRHYSEAVAELRASRCGKTGRLSLTDCLNRQRAKLKQDAKDDA